MTDRKDYFQKKTVKGGARREECALTWRGLPADAPMSGRSAAFEWSERAQRLLDRIRRKALEGKRPEARQLPYADLRGALQIRVPGLLLLRGKILDTREGANPFFAATGDVDVVISEASRAANAWITHRLSGWAERVGADEDDVASLEEMAESGQLFVAVGTSVAPAVGALEDVFGDFHEVSDPALAVISEALEGQELFPGLGPVARLISSDFDNKIAFETAPSTVKHDAFSMVAEISIETRPSSSFPIITVRAKRRLWARALPGAQYGRKSIGVRTFVYGERLIAVENRLFFDREGKPVDRTDALWLGINRAAEVSVNMNVEELVQNRGVGDDIFVGVPFRHGYRPRISLKDGVTAQDQLDLFDAVAGRLEPLGFARSRLREIDQKVKRALPIGPQDAETLSNAAFERSWNKDLETRRDSIRRIFQNPAFVHAPSAAKSEKLAEIVAVNVERIERAFPSGTPKLVFVSRRTEEVDLFRCVVDILFDGRVQVERRALPAGVHGLQSDLDPTGKMTRKERAERRREAWRPLAEAILKEAPGAPVVVQVEKTYDGKDERELNKLAGRNALAAIAGSTVQYLLPPEEDLSNYLFRMQAAIYDLLFAHAGLGPIPAPAVAMSGISPDRLPKIILGVSIATQARSARGRPDGAQLAVATRIDAETGVIRGRIGGIVSERMDVGSFMPLREALVATARAGQTTLGSDRATRKTSFQAFLRAAITDVVKEDPNAIVMVDGKSVTELWPWLADARFSANVSLSDLSDLPPADWRGLRFARVRDKAGRLILRQQRRFNRLDADLQPETEATTSDDYATMTMGLVEALPEGEARGRHFLACHSFDVKNQGARGQSSYRALTGYVRARGDDLPSAKGPKMIYEAGEIGVWSKPSRIPSTIEITVAGEAEAEEVAALVASMRLNHSHTSDVTTLPAPLSFEAKYREYMDNYLDAEDDDPTDDEPGSDDDEAAEDEPGAEEAVDGSDEDAGDEASDALAAESSDAVSDDVADDDEEIWGFPHSVFGPDATIGEALELLKTPDLLPELSFATPEFLQKAVPLTKRDIRMLHDEHGDEIESMTGAPWPKSRPSVEEFYQRFAVALRYPMFVIRLFRFLPDTAKAKRGPISERVRDSIYRLTAEMRSKRDLSDYYSTDIELVTLYAGTSAPPEDILEAAFGSVFFISWYRRAIGGYRGYYELLGEISDPVAEVCAYSNALLDIIQSFVANDAYSPRDCTTRMLSLAFGASLFVDVAADVAEVREPDDADTTLAALSIHLTSPSLTLPDWLDVEFVRSCLTATGGDIRRLQAERDWIRKVSGFEWPDAEIERDDVPAIWREAIRHPGFVLFVVPRIMGVGKERHGVPNQQIRQSMRMAISRLRRLGIVSGDETSPSTALKLIKNGHREDHVLADLLGLPAWVAFDTPCGKVALGLDALIDHGGRLGDMGRYLKEMVGPFAGFPAEMTVHEAFTKNVLPLLDGVVDQADLQDDEAHDEPESSAGDVQADVDAPERDDASPLTAADVDVPHDAVSPSPDSLTHTVEAPSDDAPDGTPTMTNDDASTTEPSKAAPAVSTSGRSSDDPASIQTEWRTEALEVAATMSRVAGEEPGDAAIERLRQALETLQLLKLRSDALPRTAATAEFVARLGDLISRISRDLAEISEEASGAEEIRALLQQIGAEASTDQIALARQEEDKASETLRLADEVTTEIADLDASGKPLRAISLLKVDLYGRQEELLRSSLGFVGASVQALILGSSAVARGAPAAPVPSVAPVLPVEPQPAPAAVETVPANPAEVASAIQLPPEPVDADDVDEVSEIDQSDIAVLDEAIASGRSEVIPGPTEDELTDPLRDLLMESLDRLFELGEFGLAYHLLISARALLSEVTFDYEPNEFVLAAAGGRYSGRPPADVETLNRARGEAIDVIQGLEEQEDPRSQARRILLLAAAIPAALFRVEDIAALDLVKRIGSDGITTSFFDLVNAVNDNSKRNYPITAPNLAAAAALADEARFMKDAIRTIKVSIESFRGAQFSFKLGQRIKASSLFDGVIGKLEKGLESDPYKAAVTASAALASRDLVVTMMAEITEKVGNRSEIDGAARERLISLFMQVGQNCADLVAPMESLIALRAERSRLELITGLREQVLTGIRKVAHAATESSGHPLVDAAFRHAARMMEEMRPTFEAGVADMRPAAPLPVSLHAPLLWLPNLTWTGGWQPSPYDPEALKDAIQAIDAPLLGEDKTASIEAAFNARWKEGSFVAAGMLLNISKWHGVPAATVEALGAKLDADKEVRKTNVQAKLTAAIRKVDRMRRMAVGGLDQAIRLRETLAQIDVNELPIRPQAFMPDRLDGDRIVDFNTALARIDAVTREADDELGKAEVSFKKQIDDMCDSGVLNADRARELRTLLQAHDLTTLADWLGMLEKGEDIRPIGRGPLNKRLQMFRSALPNIPSINLSDLSASIRDGARFGLLDYGHLDAARRDDALRAVESYAIMKRVVNATGQPHAQIQAHIQDAISSLFYDVSKLSEIATLSRAKNQILVFDAKISLPAPDPTSLLLPEFGSATQGSWRVAVVGGATSNNDIIPIADKAKPQGVLIVMLGQIGMERRDTLRLELFRRNIPALVVDEAMLATALADPDDRRRALVEIAQGFSGAEPYKDYGRSTVPPEMFKGRARERADIEQPHGSYVVFGGRRLGKTALLRHIASHPTPNTRVAFVDLDRGGAFSEQMVFELAAEALGEDVVPKSIKSGRTFAAAVETWLAGDERRRVLLLLDEADKFIRHESETQFQCVTQLLQLMAKTNHRFKFVLAGLHNVARSVRAENSPLVQISNNPLRIGPLVDRDVADAEFLVRGPLAAMGFEFESREDCLRILSFTNYYPVLIQVFCESLLRIIQQQTNRTKRLPVMISSNLVEQALQSKEVRQSLFETFDKSISFIEERYKLLTYILASREVFERTSGMAAGDGLSPADAAKAAISWWPQAFPKGSDPIEIEYLLEELEGFGIARRTSSGRFTLRSRMLIDLVATEEQDLLAKLHQFQNREAPPSIYDPKNHRRKLPKPTLLKAPGEGRISPLTDGQESDILRPDAKPVTIVFGPRVAGIHLMEAALSTSARASGDQIDVEVRNFGRKSDLQEALRKSPREGRQRVVVVSSASAWTPDWVTDAERIARTPSRQVRVVFIGQPAQALSWASDPVAARREMPGVRIIKLRPWTRSFLAAELERRMIDPSLLDDIRMHTGGWNELVEPLLLQLSDIQTALAASKIEDLKPDKISDTGFIDDLGVPPNYAAFLGTLASYAATMTLTTKDFHDLCSEEDVDARLVALYGDLIGLLDYPVSTLDESQPKPVEFNTIAIEALKPKTTD